MIAVILREAQQRKVASKQIEKRGLVLRIQPNMRRACAKPCAWDVLAWQIGRWFATFSCHNGTALVAQA